MNGARTESPRAVYDLRLWYSRVSTDGNLEAVLSWLEGLPVHSCLMFNADFNLDPPFMALEEHERRAERLTSVVQRIAERGIVPAINVLHTTGHGNKRMDLRSEFGFQPVVGSDGEEVGGAVCPLDPELREHVARIYRAYAQTGAEHIWIDDDLRVSHKMQRSDYCFCPLHMSAMSRLTGRPWTRQRLIDALHSNSDGVYAEWWRLNAESIVALLSRIETAVHGVDDQIRLGLMTCGCATGRSIDAELRTLHGQASDPLLRPGGGYWWDEDVLGALRKRIQMRSELPLTDVAFESSYELESYPYWPSLKSTCAMSIESNLNVLDGTDRIMLNVFDALGPIDPDGRLKRYLLGHHRYLLSIRLAVEGMRAVGVNVLRSPDFARNREFGQWTEELSRIGVPTVSRSAAIESDGSPAVLCGTICETLDDQEIASLLENGAILDWACTSECIRRDVAHFGALKIEKRRIEMRDIAYERIADDPFNGPFSGVPSELKLDTPLLWSYLRPPESALGSGDSRQAFYSDTSAPRAVYVGTTVTDTFTALSEWVAADRTVISPSLIHYRGRMSSIAFLYSVREGALLAETRSYQIGSYLSRLPDWIGLRVAGTNAVPIVYTGASEVVVGVARFSLDPIEELTLWLSDRMGRPKGAVLTLRDDGRWHSCGYTVAFDPSLPSGATLILRARVAPMSVRLFRWET